MAKKESIENILKRLQSINKALRYQVCLGKSDLEVMIKICKEFDWKPYRKIEIFMIDPNNEVPSWDLSTKKDQPQKDTVNPYDVSKQAGKRGAIESPEGHLSKRSNMDDWQIQEFVWAYLKDT